MNSEIKNQVLLCVGVPHSRRRQELMAKFTEDNRVIVLKFPEDEVTYDHANEYVDVHWDTYTDDVANNYSGPEVDVIFTFNDIHVQRVSKLAERLRPKMAPYPVETAIRCTDKAAMKQALKQGKVATCPFRIWTDAKEYLESVDALELQDKHFVLKPSTGTGSLGVYHREPNVSLGEAYNDFMTLCNAGDESPIGVEVTTPPYLIEPYIDRFGAPAELAVEGYVKHGKVKVIMVSEKLSLMESGPFLKENYVSPPISRYVLKDMNRIAELAQETCEALALDNSVFHLELRYDDAELKVLEIGARPGGSLISPACELRTGINLYEQHLRMVSGHEPIRVTPKQTATAFGSIYYKDGFNIDNMEHVINYLNDKDYFFDLRANPDKRLHTLDDWLISFGVTESNVNDAYKLFQEESRNLEYILEGYPYTANQAYSASVSI